VGRAKRFVKKYTSHVELLADVKQRGFHVIETGSRYVIVSNDVVLKIHC